MSHAANLSSDVLDLDVCFSHPLTIPATVTMSRGPQCMRRQRRTELLVANLQNHPNPAQHSGHRMMYNALDHDFVMKYQTFSILLTCHRSSEISLLSPKRVAVPSQLSPGQQPNVPGKLLCTSIQACAQAIYICYMEIHLIISSKAPEVRVVSEPTHPMGCTR